MVYGVSGQLFRYYEIGLTPQISQDDTKKRCVYCWRYETSFTHKVIGGDDNDTVEMKI